MIRSISSSTRWYSCALSMRIAWKSSVSRSRSSRATMLCSWNSTAGARDDSLRCRISVQILWNASRSPRMSSFGRPPAAVRMMTPPVKPRSSRNSRTMPRSRPRSSRDSILRDTPIWSTVGMNTRNRPAIVTCDVRRAPLVPSGSLTTSTRISWPSFSSSSIFGWRRSPLPPSALPGPSSSSESSLSNSAMASTTSATYRKPSRSSPRSMNEHCMPGRTFETRPLYALPTTPRWRSRSTKTSATRSSSRMATMVSWPLEEMIISLVIHELLGRERQPYLPFLPKSVRESAHAYVQNEPEAGERRNHRRPAVAHERQREPFDGRQSGRHGDVVNHLEGEAGEHAEHEVRAEPVLGQTGGLERAQNHEQIQAERHEDAGKTLLFGQHREDEIVVGNREEPKLALRPVPEALA